MACESSHPLLPALTSVQMLGLQGNRRNRTNPGLQFSWPHLTGSAYSAIEPDRPSERADGSGCTRSSNLGGCRHNMARPWPATPLFTFGVYAPEPELQLRGRGEYGDPDREDNPDDEKSRNQMRSKCTFQATELAAEDAEEAAEIPTAILRGYNMSGPHLDGKFVTEDEWFRAQPRSDRDWADTHDTGPRAQHEFNLDTLFESEDRDQGKDMDKLLWALRDPDRQT
ncbi:hypothetical protein B0H17DRAFT_1144050 [Mycena rosella]|uniref:Uncharacterized protein n=1 Tax=Mycena rosella TaxID=1033263 RepID=A0AAD7CTT1_MYCRO|nr:hypothetical protein B0H17DRAFT_1144050 [Mycena rosella]